METHPVSKLFCFLDFRILNNGKVKKKAVRYIPGHDFLQSITSVMRSFEMQCANNVIKQLKLIYRSYTFIFFIS
jgi:hypothetical protein